MRSVSRYPDRLVGLAGFNPLLKLESVRRVERAVKEFGFKGVYIHTYGFGIPLNDRLYYPLYAKCVELGIPVSMQVGHSAEHMPNELGRPIHLDIVALDFPELKLIGAHTGWPWTEEMISLAWKHENVYLGIDAHNPKYLEPTLIHFIKTRGTEQGDLRHQLPGGPARRSRSPASAMISACPRRSPRRILHRNAAQVYGL